MGRKGRKAQREKPQSQKKSGGDVNVKMKTVL